MNVVQQHITRSSSIHHTSLSINHLSRERAKWMIYHIYSVEYRSFLQVSDAW